MVRKGKQATISTTFERIRYEHSAPHVARVVLARSEQRNAQDRKMLDELDRAFRIAVADNDVKVMIVAADGPIIRPATI